MPSQLIEQLKLSHSTFFIQTANILQFFAENFYQNLATSANSAMSLVRTIRIIRMVMDRFMQSSQNYIFDNKLVFK